MEVTSSWERSHAPTQWRRRASSLREAKFSPNRHLVEDRAIARDTAPKRHAIPDEASEEGVTHRFHLHVIAEHSLAWVAIVRGWRQESFKRVVNETIPLVGADAEMSRENRKSVERDAVARVIEDADAGEKTTRESWIIRRWKRCACAR